MTELPPIVGCAEVAELTGLTKFRVAQLRPLMPEPDVELACGPVWRRQVILDWWVDRIVQGKARAALDQLPDEVRSLVLARLG